MVVFVTSDRSRWVLVLVAVLCLVLPEARGGKIVFPETESTSETTAVEDAEVTEVQEKQPESRGLWESDLFFLQKLSGIFGGGDEDQKQKPSRQGGLRPELLPPQLAFSPNRRVGQGNQRPTPQRRVPVFRLPTLAPPQQALSPPQNSLQSASHNSIIRLPPPPQPPSSPPPPPTPPPSRVPFVPVNPVNNFPYEFELPAGLTPPAPSGPVYTPVQLPSRVDLPPQPSKPVAIKPSKQKKPTALDSSSDLAGAFSITRKPQLLLPARPRPQLPQQQLISRPGTEPQNILAPGHSPKFQQQHPRPAPQPQKQHPRPPPQPQRVVIQPEKPTVIHKKPIYPDFKPSPQEGSMLADAFQPVFVASPSMDDLDALGNDIMKPMTHVSARSAVTLPTTTKGSPKLEDFF